jgi:chitinase
MPEDIDAFLCTHVIYAFATLKNHLLSESSEKDAEMYERLIALREKNPDIKVAFDISNIYIYINKYYLHRTSERRSSLK